MKKKILYAIILLAGLLLIIGPQTFLHPCEMEGMACIYTAKTATLLGIVIAVEGLTGLFLSDAKSVVLSAVTVIVTAVVAILTPSFIGVCGMAEMACRVKTAPGIYVISIVTIVLAAILLITELISARKNK